MPLSRSASEELEGRVFLSTVPSAVVTASGRSAPGVAGGVVLAPVPSHLPILPSINNAGDVAFRAQVAGPGVTEANDWAVFFARSGGSAVTFREGQAAPGYAGGEVLHEGRV